MSTSYITRDEDWTNTKIAEATGWTVHETKQGHTIWTDGSNYAHVYTPPENPEGPCRLFLNRFGANQIEDFVEALDAVSEYEDEYFEILDLDEEAL